MYKEIFDINTFNIFSDEDNYYFFRALNIGDNSDIESGITIDTNGNITRIRTDRERYHETPKYNEDSEISLEEIFNHIKVHHRIDTNCISLTSNANAAALYGRGYYKDRYVMVKVPKKELGIKVYNAGLYMVEEIDRKIKEYISNNEISTITKYYLDAIDNSKTESQIQTVIEQGKTKDNENNLDIFEKGITYEINATESVDYQALSPVQNFEKNKLIAKLDIIGKNILPNVDNKNLIRTLGNAFSSLELISYKDIEKDNIQELPKEVIDILSLIQQVPAEYKLVGELKKDILEIVKNQKYSFDEFKYQDRDLDTKDEYTIENMYNLTSGNVDFYDAINLYKKSFYLSKSILRAKNSFNSLLSLIDNNKYKDIIEYLKNNTYGVEPEIFSKQSSNKMKVSESVNLDFSPNESELFSFIRSLSNNDLNYIIQNPKMALKYYLDNFKSIDHIDVEKDFYYANAVIDLFDWSKLDVKEISPRQREQIIDKLVENHVVQVYDELKYINKKEEDIVNILLTTIIKEKSMSSVELKDTFTLEELEDFLGYYKVNGTKGLKLRSYQATSINNIENIFKEKQFASAILPTGAGKSFVALTEMLNYADKEILYLAPSDIIINQIKNYILEYVCDESLKKSDEEKINERFKNITFCTYQNLLSDKKSKIFKGEEGKIVNHKYDLIIFDELHRTGAEEWKKSITDLLDYQDENTKVLGITATPIRDTDNNDMCEHWAKYYGYTDEEIIRHKHIAINMDLEEAVNLGYVINPKIVQCEYSLETDGSLQRLKELIEQETDEAQKQKHIAKFEELRKRVLSADNIEKVIGDNIKQGGKYIIFCPVVNSEGKVIEDEDGLIVNNRISGLDVIEKYQKEMIFNIMKYRNITDIDLDINYPIKKFHSVASKLGLQFNSLLGSYCKSKNANELRKFEKEEPNKTKFIAVINMLNEGGHVHNIDGLIWFRPLDENSRILYSQQLGRIIYSIDPNKEVFEEDRTTAIDIVNNRFRVNFKRKNKKSSLSNIDQLIIIKGWIDQHNGKIPDINSKDKIEAKHANTLIKIQSEFIKYIMDESLLDDVKNSGEVLQIIHIGQEIDLWNYQFSDEKTNVRKRHEKSENIDDVFSDNFEISSIVKDYYDLNTELKYPHSKSDEYKILMVERIKQYCKDNRMWPHVRNKKNKTKDGTTSDSLYRWLQSSGYTYGNFKYSDIVDENGKPIKETLDELKLWCDQLKIISWVEKIKEFCEDKRKWPQNANKVDIIMDGTTSGSLYSWLQNSGYTYGNFKYSGIVDENGKPIKETLDELKLWCDQLRIISWVEKIKEFCENKRKWPQDKNIKDKTKDGTTSASLYYWLEYSGYTCGNFKYSDVVDESGKPIKKTLDELKLWCDQLKIIPWVEKIKIFCEDKRKWPQNANTEDIAKDGTTSASLYGWLLRSGYTCGNFLYSDVVDENGKPIKETLDELKKWCDQISVIQMVKKIDEFCKDKKAWPQGSNKTDITKDGTTSASLYYFLQDSGYTSGNFKFSDILDESGKPIKETLDELKKWCQQISIIQMVEKIHEFCKDKRKWPQGANKTDITRDGTTSATLYNFLFTSGYTKGKFKYSDIVDETGKPIKETLDELYFEYNIKKKKSYKKAKEEFDNDSEFSKAVNSAGKDIENAK